jgi:hypothetical protein
MILPDKESSACQEDEEKHDHESVVLPISPDVSRGLMAAAGGRLAGF